MFSSTMRLNGVGLDGQVRVPLQPSVPRPHGLQVKEIIELGMCAFKLFIDFIKWVI